MQGELDSKKHEDREKSNKNDGGTQKYKWKWENFQDLIRLWEADFKKI